MSQPLFRVLTGLVVLVALAPPARGQQSRQIPLDLARGEIDRRYLPARDTFYFLVRAASELLALRGEYRRGDDPPTTLATWSRREGTRSRDATLRVAGLEPGVTYRFAFTLVRRPTGNEGRLIETAARSAMSDGFRLAPRAPMEEVAERVAPSIRASLLGVMPGAVPDSGSAFGGRAGPLEAALAARGVDVAQAAYRTQADLVDRLRGELTAARLELVRTAGLRTPIDAISAGLNRGGRFAELVAPVEACRAVIDPAPADGPGIASEVEQRALLFELKVFDAALGACRGLLRDARLPRYRAIRPAGVERAADLLIPVEGRLAALRTATERLIWLGGKREGAINQVASDLRRSLDTKVTRDTSIVALLTADPGVEVPPAVTLGVGLAGVYAPCSASGSCLRIVPDLTVAIKLAGLLNAEIGFTLANTEATGRTRHLFWSTSGMLGLSARLGDTRAQRIGAGVLVLRKAGGGGTGFDTFRLGGYLGVTIFDFRL